MSRFNFGLMFYSLASIKMSNAMPMDVDEADGKSKAEQQNTLVRPKAGVTIISPPSVMLSLSSSAHQRVRSFVSCDEITSSFIL